MKIQIIERHAKPSNYHYAPYGTIYKVLKDTTEYFIQISQEPDKASWKPISYLLEELYKDLYNDQQFLEELLQLYSDNNHRADHNNHLRIAHLQRIIELLILQG